MDNSNKFTIVYKTYKNDLQWIKYSLLSLIKFLDFSNIYELIIYTHDVVYGDLIKILKNVEIDNYVKNKVIPVHYNYHGYIKQMVIKANSFKDCLSKYVVILDSDLFLRQYLNFKNFIREDGKIQWKYSKIEDNNNHLHQNFTVWKNAFESITLSKQNVHYMSNDVPYIFTRESLENASKKFIE